MKGRGGHSDLSLKDEKGSMTRVHMSMDSNEFGFTPVLRPKT